MSVLVSKRLIFIVICMMTLASGLIYGTLRLNNYLIDFTLKHDVEDVAHNWAKFLRDNPADFRNFVSGQEKENKVTRFLKYANLTGRVFRYKIFNAQGYEVFVSDNLTKIEKPEIKIGDHHANKDFFLSVLAGNTYTLLKEGTPPKRPEKYGEVYVPVFLGKDFGGIVEVYVNQTDQYALFSQVQKILVTITGTLAFILFLIPMIFIWLGYRQKHKLASKIQKINASLEQMVTERTEELMDQKVRLEEALSKEKELNDLQRGFVSMASHEFRTPLAIIDGSAQRLARKVDKLTSDDILERTQIIRNAVKRMTTLMESTLNAARMEAGKIQIKPVPCDINAILKECRNRQKEIAHSHNITLETTDLPETIVADPACLDQIFTNLLSNAVKYSPNAPDIRIKAWKVGEKVAVSITDNGIGIDEDDLPRMCERFFRAKTSTGIAGTGIGLNLTKLLVDEHEGEIVVTSQKGSGSTFTVCFPIAGPHNNDAQSTDNAA